MSATQPCDSPGFGISAARQRSQTRCWTGAGWSTALVGEHKVSLCGSSLPEQCTVAMLQPPARLVLPLVLPSRAARAAVRQKWNLQASRCGELPFLILENKGQNWEFHTSLPCLHMDCHPTGEPHLVPLGADPSIGQGPPTLGEFSLGSPCFDGTWILPEGEGYF